MYTLNKYAISLTPKRLKLILLPTEKCNFRCSYCWERHNGPTMRQSIINSIKQLLSYRISNQLDILEVEWFGGEPLCAKDIIYDIGQHIQGLVQSNNVQYTARITTNGFLLDYGTFEKLVHLNINKFAICLDGLNEIHDKTRCLTNGDGSFDVIMTNLIAIHNSDLDFSMLITINFFEDAYKQDTIPLVQYLDKTFGDDDRFSFFFKSIQRFGGDNDCLIKEISSYREEEIINELMQHVSKLHIISKKTDYICFAAELNTMIIRADGRINKCIIALEAECNQVGNIIPDGKVNLDTYKFKQWSSGFAPFDINKLKCPYKHLFIKN